jgi:hypothetical protein
MSLLEQVKALCDRLAPLGWQALLLKASNNELDIVQPSTSALREQLLKPLTAIRRDLAGFADFSLEGRQAITPGSPAHSLLYHALASPGVGRGLGGFPTLAEIEAVENFVFGAIPPTIGEIRQRAGISAGADLSVVVFACEYRPAADTCSRVQADMVFSRTGISRVGTAPPRYDGRQRGFVPEVDDDVFGLRVAPARYAAYLAARKPGGEANPMRRQDGDAARDFWVPVHKLFSGKECIAELDLALQFDVFHYNDKIRRTRAITLNMPDVPAEAPFLCTEGLAELSTDPAFGQGVLVPVPHARLVEPAMVDGKPLTFRVPHGHPTVFAALEEPAGRDDPGGFEMRRAPAYVHARTAVKEGTLTDMNAAHADINAAVMAGGYDALHYVDFTGDGWVDVQVPVVQAQPGVSTDSVPCYSLIGAPDFFPAAGQRELIERVDVDAWRAPPSPLCDSRVPANLQMPGNRFSPQDETITALVPLGGWVPKAQAFPASIDAARHSCLPDDSAGYYAPGWDVSADRLSVDGKVTPHLAAYGLGSPFPEDAKLCAALATFWPTVAPDISRSLSANTGIPARPTRWETIAPLTDQETGQAGGLPWDGVPGPRIVKKHGAEFVEFADFLHVDYVQNALANKFSIRMTARVGENEYARRMAAMASVYAKLGGERTDYVVLSFRQVLAGDAELMEAQEKARAILPGTTYRVETVKSHPKTEKADPDDPRKRLLPVDDRRCFYVDPHAGIVLQRRQNQDWKRLS